MLDLNVGTRLGDFSVDANIKADAGVTLVNMLAGLLRPERGHIIVQGEIMFDREQGIDIPPEGRGIGYVFQESRLFPHMSVAANLNYGRRQDAVNFDAVVDLLAL